MILKHSAHKHLNIKSQYLRRHELRNRSCCMLEAEALAIFEHSNGRRYVKDEWLLFRSFREFHTPGIYSLAFHSRNSGLIQGWSVWELWWIKWHQGKFSTEHFAFPFVSYHTASSTYASLWVVNRKPICSPSTSWPTLLRLAPAFNWVLNDIFLTDEVEWHLMRFEHGHEWHVNDYLEEVGRDMFQCPMDTLSRSL